MGRRIGTIGLVLALVGLPLTVLVEPPLVESTAPSDLAMNVLYSLVPTLAAVLAAAGAVMLALGVVVGLTGHPPLRQHRLALLWSGLVLALLSALAEVATFSGGYAWDESLLLVIVYAFVFLRLLGASLLALWLTGLLVAGDAASRDRRAARPARTR